MKSVCWISGFGVLFTLMTLLMPYEFCMDGPGRGLPFAIVAPYHGETEWWVLPTDKTEKRFAPAFDLRSLGGDLLVWTTLATFGYLYVRSLLSAFTAHRDTQRQKPT